jgi:hypothetical protein
MGRTTLALARCWYLILGGGALFLTANHALGALDGSRFDAPLVMAGIAVGVLAVAAAAWVVSSGMPRAIAAWLGVLAGFAPLAVAFWLAATTAGTDAQVLAAVPTVLGLLAAARMALARLQTPPSAVAGARGSSRS